MKIVTKAALVLGILFTQCGALLAQSIPVTSLMLDEYYRRMQLTGKLDSTVSFTIRPLVQGTMAIKQQGFDPDSSLQKGKWTQINSNLPMNPDGVKVQVMPLTWKQQLNSRNPYGWNDGAMIPAKGYQSLLNGGIFASYKFLSIQLAPEFVYAANSRFETSGVKLSGIDAPERFGDKSYSKFLWGQSSIRLNFGPASVGLSTENLWWGPGRRNSLLMSANASGFKHITLNTRYPIATPIGSFEGQFIGGKLESSNIAPYDETYEEQDWRYLSGMNISYQPKWVPGLFLGFTRVFQAYNHEVRGLSGYIPFLTPFQKNKTSSYGDDFPRDQILSFYGRWLFPKANAEVYVEFGVNDNSHDLRDFIGAPEHSRAYLFGFTKLVPFKGRPDEFIEVNAEVTQTSQNIDRVVRPAGSWYTHSQVKHGYTHKGQILGAGMGIGGNVQSLHLSWVKGLKKLGVAFDRYEHNPHNAPSLMNGRSRKWVDYAIAGVGEWNYENLLLQVKLQGIKSLNYQWRLKDYTPGNYYVPHNDVFNFHGEIGLAYRF